MLKPRALILGLLAAILLLTGAGDAFCAGGNAKAMATDEQPPLEERVRGIRFESEVVAVIHEMAKPSIAALPGPAGCAFPNMCSASRSPVPIWIPKC